MNVTDRQSSWSRKVPLTSSKSLTSLRARYIFNGRRDTQDATRALTAPPNLRDGFGVPQASHIPGNSTSGTKLNNLA
jgi:hypothetical protein